MHDSRYINLATACVDDTIFGAVRGRTPDPRRGKVIEAVAAAIQQAIEGTLAAFERPGTEIHSILPPGDYRVVNGALLKRGKNER